MKKEVLDITTKQKKDTLKVKWYPGDGQNYDSSKPSIGAALIFQRLFLSDTVLLMQRILPAFLSVVLLYLTGI